MRGVILAAGRGTRLSPYNGKRPKVLLPVAGRAIIDYTLESFSKAGVTDVSIVIGHQGDVLKQWVGDGPQRDLHIQYVYNPDYERGNALSLQAARPFTGDDPFLLSMADHMVSPGILERLLETREPANVLAVDFAISPRHIEEGTRVLVSQEGLVTSIGKNLSRWNAIDAGVLRLTPDIFNAVADILGEKRHEYQISQAMTRMLQRGNHIIACDISGCFWQDIDTWEDLNLASKSLAAEEPWAHPAMG